MKKKIMREVTITVCDYCGEEITDYMWAGGESTDFHDMKSGGSKGILDKTCYEKHNEKDKDALKRGS